MLAGKFCILAWLVLGIAMAAEKGPGEKALLARLFAPCCYRETLDIHQSPLAAELRTEIHERVAAGESPEAIETALVVRFGERLQTRPPPTSSSLAWLALAAAVVTFGSFLALRRPRESQGSPAVGRHRAALQTSLSEAWTFRDQALQDELDDALSHLD